MTFIIISIHAPRVRCDHEYTIDMDMDNISIHAPRVRCDTLPPYYVTCYNYFNPRTSCEVRHISVDDMLLKTVFQSTHLVWGATFLLLFRAPMRIFQSTHLVWGATYNVIGGYMHALYFNPRTSCEVRHQYLKKIENGQGFQSTHLVWGATCIGNYSTRI